MSIRRCPKNVPGDFYTTGDCLACGVPETEAPDLLAPLSDANFDTYFVRQPVTAAEIDRACNAVEVCCVDALRYCGTDPQIRKRLGRDACDDLSNFQAGDNLSTGLQSTKAASLTLRELARSPVTVILGLCIICWVVYKLFKTGYF
jgi:hypothetical protein